MILQGCLQVRQYRYPVGIALPAGRARRPAGCARGCVGAESAKESEGAVGAEGVGIQLVNLSPAATRRLIVQAGAFGEHQFKGVKFQQGDLDEAAKNGYGWVRAERISTEKEIDLDAAYFSVELPPSSSIRLQANMSRFANQPSYNLPWG